MSGRIRPFGPFTNIPCDDIKTAGFHCPKCRKPVEKFAMMLPAMVPRMIFYSCRCGTVTVWEDESQPENSEIWSWNVDLLRKHKVHLVMFNGDKPLSPGFAGQN
jgi:hypothetical protein